MLTAQSPSYEYQVGGSLPLNAPSYVKRQADDELFQALLRSEFCYVLNSRQMGKSSLWVQTLHRLQAEDIRCGVIDLTAIGTQEVTPEQWYASVVGSLTSTFQLQFNLRAWWRDRTHLSLVNRLSEFIETVLLVEIQQNIVIFIDEIDSLLSLSFPTDDFFALIRACYNKRAQKSSHKRLTFALLGVATPSDLIADKNRTPFNIGRAIELRGFELHEAIPLIPGLQKIASQPEVLLAEILHWTSGQPFLTQKLCQLTLMTTNPISVIPAGEEALWVEQLVQEYIINNWETQDDPEHLRTIRDRILSNSQRAARLLGIYQQILQQGEIATDDSPVQMELLLSGLVVKQQSFLKVKNPIYQKVFNGEWVEEQLASLRPYSQAFNTWIASKQTDESRLLRGQALKDAQTWAQGKSLSDLDYQFLAASQELDRWEVQLALEAERAKEVEARLAEEHKRLVLERKTAKRQRRLIGALSGVLMVAIASSILALWQYHHAVTSEHQARISEIQALTSSSAGQFASQQKLDALVTAIKARRRLDNLANSSPQLQDTVGQLTGGSDPSPTPPANKRLRPLFSPHPPQSPRRGGKIRKNFFSRENERGGESLSSSPFPTREGGWGVRFSKFANSILHSQVQQVLQQAIYGTAEFNRLSGHSSPVLAVDVSPDGQLIVTGSGDQTAKIWQRDGTLLHTLQHKVGSVYTICFTPDSQRLVTSTVDGNIYLWSREGKLLKTFQGHNAAIWAMAMSPDGQRIASASEDSTIRLWSIDGKLLKTLTGHQGGVWGVAFSPEGNLLVSSSTDGTVKVWNLDGELLRTLPGHSGTVWDVEFVLLADKNGTKRPTIVSASADNTVKLWQPDGTLLRTLSGHSSEVFEIAVNTAGDVIASAGADQIINLWKPDGTLLKTLKGHQSGIRGVTFIPNSQMVVSVSDDNTARLWNPTNPFSKVLYGHDGTIWDVDFSPEGQMLVSASSDGSFKVWAQDGTLLKSFAGNGTAVYAVAFLQGASSANSVPILAAASEDKTIKLWQFNGTLLKTITGHSAGVWDIAASPDGQLLASASNDKTVKLWDKNGTLLKTFHGHQARVYDVDFTPDGKRLVSASSDATARLWSLDGKFSKILKGHRSPIWEVAISPDGHTLATASRDDTIKLWTSDGALLKTLKGNTRGMMAVDFSPDGQILVTGGSTGVLKLWKIDGTEITTLTGHEGNVWGVVFSPDGKQIASAGDDRTIILWDVERILKLNELGYACDRVRDYLRTNAEVKEEDRHWCDGLKTTNLPSLNGENL